MFNLKGNQNTSDWRREGGKVFDAGAKIGVAITMLVKTPTLQSTVLSTITILAISSPVRTSCASFMSSPSMEIFLGPPLNLINTAIGLISVMIRSVCLPLLDLRRSKLRLVYLKSIRKEY